jgi:DNA-binding beta-propeller fold protein YncE
VKVSNDGLVYVCDRTNNRIQVFKKDGSFVKEWFYEKNTLGSGAVWDILIWPDPKQTWLLSADGSNNEIRVLKREDGSVVGSFGHNGRNAGQFHWVHTMAIDPKGNIYTGEVDTGKRIQKFKLISDALK